MLLSNVCVCVCVSVCLCVCLSACLCVCACVFWPCIINPFCATTLINMLAVDPALNMLNKKNLNKYEAQLWRLLGCSGFLAAWYVATYVESWISKIKQISTAIDKLASCRIINHQQKTKKVRRDNPSASAPPTVLLTHLGTNQPVIEKEQTGTCFIN